MSLLDDVSIVVTPNGYKAGTLFAVKPTIAYGSELVVNGDFSEGDTGWTIEAVWTISGGAAHGNGASGSSQELKQTILEVGKTYEFSYEIRNRVSGSVELLNSGLGATTSNQVYIGIGIATSTELRFRPSSFNGDIYNVSVREFTGADMDVTRATAATRVDENGLVNYAEIIGGEEVTNGDFATDTDWTKGAGWTISGGTASHTGGASYLSQAVLQVNTLYKVNISVTAVSGGGFVQIYMGNNPASVLISQIGDYTYYFTSQSSVTLGLALRSLGDVTIDNVSVKEAARDNVPRIDYTGGGCPHILAEPQRTNLVTDSVDVDTYFTNQVDATVTNNYGTSPTGENNSTRVQWADSTSFIYRAESVSTDTSASIFVKGTSGETVMFGFGGNVTTGDIYTFDGSWQRIIFTGSAGTTIFLSSYGGATATDFEVFGLQVEVGSYATSYIPTSGSTVTRNQDIFTRDGIGSLINSEEGVLFVEMAALSNDSTRRSISLSDGTNTNRVVLRYDNASNRVQGFIQVGGATNGNINDNSYTITNFLKIAYKWKAGDFALWINGTEVATSTSATSFGAGVLTEMQFNEGDGAGGEYFGKVKQLQVYDTSLSDTQLAALTSL